MKTFRSRSSRCLLGIASVIILCNLVCASKSIAEIPKKLSYQGVLTDSNGTPLSGQYRMKFSIYNDAAEGSYLWSEEWMGGSMVTVNDGLFNVLLGSIEPIDFEDIPFDATYWLKVEVYNESSSSYEPLSPRHELASTAYALRAATVENGAIGAAALDANSVTVDKISDGAITNGKVAASGLSATKITSDTIDNARINWAAPGNIGTSTAGVGYFTNLFASGNMGIGTTSPARRVHIKNATSNWYDDANQLFISHSDNANFGLQLGYGYQHGVAAGGKIQALDNGAGTRLLLNPGGGNVGIGTTNPSGLLHLKKDSGDNRTTLLVENSGIGTGYANGSVGITFGKFDGVQIRHQGVYYKLAGPGWADSRTTITSYLATGVTDDTLNVKAGNVGIGETDPGYKLDVDGAIKGASYACPNGDIAEKLIIHPNYELSDEKIKAKASKLDLPDTEKQTIIERKEISKIEPGTVVVISKDGVVPCARENDTRLAGIISTSPAVKMASEEKGQYVALAGNVPCKVIGKIKAGDMLTTSTIEGHAQKAEQPVLGAIVGKALVDFDGERGVIDVWAGGM